jgi:hypothetical protein
MRCFVFVIAFLHPAQRRVVSGAFSTQIATWLGEITPKGFDRAVRVYEVKWAG